MTGQLLIYQQSSLDEAKRNPGLGGTVALYYATLIQATFFSVTGYIADRHCVSFLVH